MKKNLLILIFISLFLITGCTTQKQKNTSKSESENASNENIEIIENVEVQREPVQNPGTKTITVTIMNKDQVNKTETFSTDTGNLLDFLNESGLGNESEDIRGYITTVDGYTADLEKGEWWLITKNNEALSTSADQTILEDGDNFYFELQKID